MEAQNLPQNSQIKLDLDETVRKASNKCCLLFDTIFRSIRNVPALLDPRKRLGG